MTDRGGDISNDAQTAAPAEPGAAAAFPPHASYYADEEDAGVPSPFVGPPDEDGQRAPAAPVSVAPTEDEPVLAAESYAETVEPIEPAPTAPIPEFTPAADAEEPPPSTIVVAPITEPVIEPGPAPTPVAPAEAPAESPAVCYVPIDPRDEATDEEPSPAPAVAPDAWDLLAAEPEEAPAIPVAAPAEEPDDSEPVVLDESTVDEEPVVAAAAPKPSPIDDGPTVDEVGDGPVVVTPAAPQLTYETLEADAVAAVVAGRADRWTIPMLCAGICLIACCVLIPAADANRRLAYERQQLQLDLDSLRKQVEVNDRFLSKVADDPNLAERLAQRQLKIVRAGTKVLQLPDVGGDEMSPYHLVAVTPPAPLPAYQPKGGLIARLCYNPRSRLYLIGVGMLMIAAGLVMGAQSKK